MRDPRSSVVRLSTYSVLLLGMLAQTCIEVESTTRFERGGSGTMTVDTRVNQSMMRSLQALGRNDGGASEGIGEEMARELRGAADTTPGIRVDSVYQGEDDGYSHRHIRVSFDSVGALTTLYRQSETGKESNYLIEQRPNRVLHITHGFASGGDDASTSEGSGIAQLGRSLAMGMFDARIRYVFPPGTTIQGSTPAVSRSDTAVVYEIRTREIVNATSGTDSLFVTAQIPAPSTQLIWWIGAGIAGVLVLAGLVIFAVRRRLKRSSS